MSLGHQALLVVVPPIQLLPAGLFTTCLPGLALPPLSPGDGDDLDEVVGEVDSSRHFSYFAFEGRTGTKRWGHESQDFHRDAAELAEVTQQLPQRGKRLLQTRRSSSAVTGRRGLFDCGQELICACGLTCRR